MATDTSVEARGNRHWLPLASAFLLLLLGLVLAIGGGWLAVLKGSWYYVLAGVAMLAAAVLLGLGRRAGAWIYGGVVLATVVWTAWESGLDYWRWVPRLGLVLALGIPVALALQHLFPLTSKRSSRLLASACVLGVAIGIGFAFVPHGVTQLATPGQAQTTDSASATSVPSGASSADSPAHGDWTAYGGSNAATRYVRGSQINRDNVGRLQRA